jgi:hypothetical protein
MIRWMLYGDMHRLRYGLREVYNKVFKKIYPLFVAKIQAPGLCLLFSLE